MNPKLNYAILRFGCLPFGFLLIFCGFILWAPGWGAINELVKYILIFGGCLVIFLGSLVLYNVYFSRNASNLNSEIPFETCVIIQDGLHNSNVDLAWYQDAFYLVHAASPYHFGSSDSKILVKRSIDGLHWEQVAVLKKGSDDIRDPKFAIIGGKLFIYVLVNREIYPLPYATWVTCTENGVDWSNLVSINQEGWILGRPKTNDGKHWYAPAYWHQFHHNVLFTTIDGVRFERLASISQRRYINEPEIEFLPDGSLLATGRGDYIKNSFHQLIGIPKTSTIISTAQPPYVDWLETSETQLTRLDGPVMFSFNKNVYAVGRAHTYSGSIFPRRGSVLGKKRTAIYSVSPQGLTHLTDLPSCGDTSYAGVVLKDGWVYIAYYTNTIKRDYIWLFGMLESCEVRMAKIDLRLLERAAQNN